MISFKYAGLVDTDLVYPQVIASVRLPHPISLCSHHKGLEELEEIFPDAQRLSIDQNIELG